MRAHFVFTNIFCAIFKFVHDKCGYNANVFFVWAGISVVLVVLNSSEHVLNKYFVT